MDPPTARGATNSVLPKRLPKNQPRPKRDCLGSARRRIRSERSEHERSGLGRTTNRNLHERIRGSGTWLTRHFSGFEPAETTSHASHRRSRFRPNIFACLIVGSRKLRTTLHREYRVNPGMRATPRTATQPTRSRKAIRSAKTTPTSHCSARAHQHPRSTDASSLAQSICLSAQN